MTSQIDKHVRDLLHNSRLNSSTDCTGAGRRACGFESLPAVDGLTHVAPVGPSGQQRAEG